MIRLAVFDLDGTLVDSRRAISGALARAWEEHGLAPPDYEQSRRIVGLSMLEAVQTLAPNEPATRHGDLIEAYKHAFVKNRAEGMQEPLYDGARATLDALKRDGWVLGIATGKSHKGIDHILRHHGLAELFACAFCADDGPGKPDPHMLHLNMRALGAEPAHTVMIGDTSFDMAMARAAHCYAVGVSWGFHTTQEILDGGAHEVVHLFAELDQTLALRAAA